MRRKDVIENIYLTLRGLNDGMGDWKKVKRGLWKMNDSELNEFLQLVISISSNRLTAKRPFKADYSQGIYY